MKFAKSRVESSKKTKTQLAEKGKFKNKTSSSNGGIQKGAKNALKLMKGGSLSNEMDNLVKGAKSVKNVISNNKRKSKLSPAVQLGLKLDEILKEKALKSDDSSPETTPKKNKQKIKGKSQSGSSPSQSSSESPKKRNRRKKKGKQVPVNGSKSSSQNPSSPENQNTGENIPPGKKALKRKIDSATRANSALSPKKQVTNKRQPLSPQTIEKTKGKAKKSKLKHNAPNAVVDHTDSPPDDSDFLLNPPDVLNAVKASLEIYRKTTASNKKLLHDEEQPVFLNFLFYQPHPHQKIIRFDLVNTLHTDDSDVCLFVTDVEKKNPDQSKALWKEILQEEKCSCISEVIPVKTLLKDYTQYEDKRKLSDRFDFFLVDAKISHRVYGYVGNKHFHAKRKTPTPVDLKKGCINDRVIKALKRTTSLYKVAAESFSIQVGHSNMKEKKIQENILHVWKQYPNAFGVYWENIRKASLCTHESPELPIFLSMKPPTTVRVFNSMVWRRNRDQPIIGELSTSLGRKVAVYPSGKVIVKYEPESNEEKPKKLSKSQRKKLQKLKAEESENDDQEGREEDMMDSDLDDTIISGLDLSSESQETSRKKPVNKKQNKKNKKNKKVTEEESEENSEESEVDRAEEHYLANLAKEKKLTKKAETAGKGKSNKGKAGVKALVTKDSDSDCDADETVYSTAVNGESSDEENVEQDIESSDDEVKSIPKAEGKKKLGKQQKSKQQQQQQVKNIKNLKKTTQIKDKNVSKKNTKNKPGAQKNQQSPKQLKQRKDTPGTNSPSQTGKKKKNSFQGVKADQIKKKSHNKKQMNKKK